MVALILALAVGFALQRFIRSASDWGRTGLAFLGASVALITFLLLFAADGITSAAALSLSPLILAIFVVSSAIGVHLAAQTKRLK